MENDSQYFNYIRIMEKFCDYQERCNYDIEMKMNRLEIPAKWTDEIKEHLKKESFFDDFRYASSFAKGKFAYKKWGKIKIAYALKTKKIDGTLISKSLFVIDDEEYFSTLKIIVENKISSLGGSTKNENIKKTLNYALQKGYESSLIWQAINELKK